MSQTLKTEFNRHEITNSRDPVTGLNTNLPLREALFLSAQKSPLPHLIELDFQNIGNLNLAMGRKFTNDFMRMCTGIIMTELAAGNPATLYGFRKSGDNAGDEFGVIITGNDGPTIAAALQRAQEKIDVYVASTDLARLEHRKPGRAAGIGFASASAPIESSSVLKNLRNDLQVKIQRAKDSATPSAAAPVPVSQFVSNASQSIADPLSAGEADFSTWIEQGQARDLTRFIEGDSQQKSLLQHNLNNCAPGSRLVRLDVHNFGLLNKHLGNEEVDEVFAVLRSKLRIALRRNNINATVYNTGGDTIDIVCPPSSEKGIELLKTQVAHTWHEILAEQEIGEITENVGLYILDHPVNQNNPRATLFEIDTLKVGYDELGVSYVNRYDSHHEVHYLDRKHQPLAVPIEKDTTPPQLALLRAASVGIESSQLLSILKRPVGQIAAFIFGENVAPALAAQTQMKELVGLGVPEEEIFANIGTEQAFHDLYASRTANFSRSTEFDLMTIASTAIRADPRIMTMTLAKSWGHAGEDPFNLILPAQAAARTLQKLGHNAALAPEKAREFMLKDIRLHCVNVKNPEVRRIQTLEQVLEFIMKTENLTGQKILSETSRAAFEFTAGRTLAQFAADSKARSYPHLHEAISRIAGPEYLEIDLGHEAQAIIANINTADAALGEMNGDLKKTLSQLKQAFTSCFPDLEPAPGQTSQKPEPLPA